MIGNGILTVSSSVLMAAVTVIGAMCVLTKGPVPAGVSSTFVNVALTPANKAKNEEIPLQYKSADVRPVIL